MSNYSDFSGDPANIDSAISFIVIYSLVSSSMMWSVGYDYLKKGLISEEKVNELNDTKSVNVQQLSGDKLIDITINTDSHSEQKETPVVNNATELPISGSGYHDVDTLQEHKSRLRKIFDKTRQLLRPPVIAIMLGLFFGLILPLRDTLVSNSGFLHFIYSGLQTLGDAAVPMSLLGLGANLTKTLISTFTKKEPEKVVSTKVITGLAIAKLVIMPLFGILFVFIASITDWIPSDDYVIRFVLMLQAATPTATNIGNMCQMLGQGEKEISLVLFWQYFFGIASLVFWVSVFLYCLQIF